jgi:hypothetical protein
MWSEGAAWSTAGSGNALIATNSRSVGNPCLIALRQSCSSTGIRLSVGE